MSAFIVLSTSHVLTKEELTTMIVEAGGRLTPDMPYFELGLRSRDTGNHLG